MNQPLLSLMAGLASLDAAWSDARPAFGNTRADGGVAGAAAVQAELESMSDPGLVATMEALGRLIREANGLLARGAAEVARRSPAEAGSEALAKRQGFQYPARLIAAVTGGSVSGAARFVSVGQATATRRSLTGQPLPAAHPHVAQALAEAPSAWRRPGRSRPCWTGSPAAPTRPRPTRTNAYSRSGPATSRSRRCCGRSARPRPGWTRTESNRARRTCARTGPSICGRTRTACCT